MASFDIPAELNGLRALRETVQGQAPGVHESDVDEGEPKRRPTGSSARELDCQFVMTNAQFAVFESWFAADLKRGSEWFNWIHPQRRDAIEARFRGANAYTYKSAPGGRVRVTASFLERTA